MSKGLTGKDSLDEASAQVLRIGVVGILQVLLVDTGAVGSVANAVTLVQRQERTEERKQISARILVALRERPPSHK